MKVHVIYHRADFDGLFSGAVCWHWLTKQGHEVSMQGWDFGDPHLTEDDVPEDASQVYVIDLPPDCVSVPDQVPFIWIDHHKSSIEKFSDSLEGYRIDGVAACRLAWQWFQQGAEGDGVGLTHPGKSEYTERRVKEPIALTLAGEYDIWDKHDPRADQFQFGLYSEPDWTPERLADAFFRQGPNNGQVWVDSLCAVGEVIMKWQRIFASQVCKGRGYYVELGGNRYWTLASVHARNSSWFPNETVPEDANGLMCYRIEGDGNVKVSLYNREGCEDIDHSVIAVAHGGGGHKGACGFQMTLGQAITEGIVK